MISNIIELIGTGVLVLGVYELAGRGWAFVVLGSFLLVFGYGLDGLTIRLRKRKPKLHLAEEPLTNRKIAEQEARR
jgi:hypothetical protein